MHVERDKATVCRVLTCQQFRSSKYKLSSIQVLHFVPYRSPLLISSKVLRKRSEKLTLRWFDQVPMLIECLAPFRVRHPSRKLQLGFQIKLLWCEHPSSIARTNASGIHPINNLIKRRFSVIPVYIGGFISRSKSSASLSAPSMLSHQRGNHPPFTTASRW